MPAFLFRVFFLEREREIASPVYDFRLQDEEEREAEPPLTKKKKKHDLRLLQEERNRM